MSFSLVMPRTIRSARLHGGEDVDQAQMITPFGDEGLNSVFLAKRLMTTNELDFQARIAGQMLGVIA